MQGRAPVSDSEALWIAAASRGDRAAAEALVNLHEKPLWLLLWRLTGSRAEADELFQVVWLEAWHHLPRFRGESRLSTWLVQIGIHAARKRVRHRGEPFFAAAEPAFDVAADPALLAERTEDEAHVARLLAKLAPREREALVLHHLHDYSFAEVAQLMGIAESTARKLAWDGMQRARAAAQASTSRGTR